jgi:hypothetical protein
MKMLQYGFSNEAGLDGLAVCALVKALWQDKGVDK